MSFNIRREGEYFIVSSKPVVYESLEEGRKAVSISFQTDGATFGRPQWREDLYPCRSRRGHWNRLLLEQFGHYSGRKIGIFGSTSGLKETFCGPRGIGEVIENEAAIRQGAYLGDDPYSVQGRKAVKSDTGSIVIAFLLPHQVSRNVKLEKLFEQKRDFPREIRRLLAA